MKKAFYKKLLLTLSGYVHRFGWLNAGLLIGSMALLPFIILAVFCHPSADDFWLTNLVIAKGPWQAQVDIRQNWSGRYTSMFLGSFNPLVYRSFTIYKLLPVLFLIFLTASLYRLITLLTHKQFSRKSNLALALIFLIIYLHQMHTVAQSIYWMSGALTYQVANILLVFFLASLYRYYQLEQNRRSLLQKILISVLLFATIGCNETTMAIVVFLIGCFFLISLIKAQKDFFLLWLVILTAVACCLVIFAPGNAIRLKEYPLRHDFVFSLVHALLVPVNNSFNWLVNSPILLISVLLVPVVAKQVPHIPTLNRVHPVIGLLVLYGCLASGYFVAYWSKHGPSPPRAQDTIYFVFLLGWFANLLILAQFFRQKYNFVTIPGYVTGVLVFWGILMIFYGKQSNIRIAYADLLSGQAYRYNQEMEARYQLLTNSSCQICPIQAAKNRPKSIFFEEVTPDTTWENTYYAKYFGKKLLLVSE